MIITKENMYEFAASEYVDIECSECGSSLNRKMTSVRSNINTNGKFICHKCKLKSKEYQGKQKNLYDSMRKIDKKYDVTCSICGKNYKLAHRTMRQIKKSGKPIICQSCGLKNAHNEGKFDYSKLIEVSPQASKKGLESEAYKTKMKELLCDEEYRKKMRECGKKGAEKHHDDYEPAPSQLLDSLDKQIDWKATFDKFGAKKESIPHNAKVIIQCAVCGEFSGINYKTIKKMDEWICFQCFRRSNIDLSCGDIDWELTEKRLGVTKENINTRSRVIIKCHECGKIMERFLIQVNQSYKIHGIYRCFECATSSEEHRIEEYKNKTNRESWNEKRKKDISESMKSLWSDEKYRSKMLKIKSDSSKKMWEKHRDKLMKVFNSDEFKEKMKNIACDMNSDTIEKISNSSRDKWNNREYRNKMINIINSDEFKTKMSESIRNSSNVRSVIDNNRELFAEKFIDMAKKMNPEYSYDLVDYVNSKTDVDIVCPIHGVFKQTPNNHIDKKNRCPRCAQLYDRSQGEVFDFVKSFGFDPKYNDRTQIHPQELDIYIEELKMAIEFHGIYWHSYDRQETTEERQKHKKKSELCEKNGIRLIQIFEHEWRDRKEIVESVIRNKLGKSHRIYARKCEIKEISSHEHKSFMDKNHIQGGKGCNVAYGLYFQDELVSVMSFNKHHKYGWEITRFANKLDTTVVGGASKLFKKFIKDHDPEQILTYADRRYSDGNLYRQLGFKFEEITSPNYCYIKNNEVHTRQQFQKHKLAKKLEVFNPELTESENMFINGYRRLWDAGNCRFVWSKN